MSSPTSRKAGEALNANDAFLIVAGSDGTGSRALLTDTAGQLATLTGNTGVVPIALATDSLGNLKSSGALAAVATAVVSPAAPGNAFGPLVSLSGYQSISGVALIQGATGGPLDVFLQTSFDGGTTWYDCVHFTQLAAAGAQVAWAFSIKRGGTAAPIAVNPVSTTPALAANTIAVGFLGTAVRYAFVAGALTTAGAAQTIFIAAGQ